jgi:hypothetical protein
MAIARTLVLAVVMIGTAAPACAMALSREDQHIQRDFLAHHRGDRVVRVFRSILGPVGDWAAVHWLAPGPHGSYSAGGGAYYHNGRAVSRPSADLVETLGPKPVWRAVSQGQGNWSSVSSDSASGQSDTTTIAFSWLRRWGPIDASPWDNTGFAWAEAGGPTMSGTGSWQHTDAQNPGMNASCTWTLASYAPRLPDNNLDMSVDASRDRRSFQWATGLDDSSGLQVATLSTPSCASQTTTPYDPQQNINGPTNGNSFVLEYSFPVKAPQQQLTWGTMTATAQLHHHSDPYDLTMQGTLVLSLAGLKAP